MNRPLESDKRRPTGGRVTCRKKHSVPEIPRVGKNKAPGVHGGEEGSCGLPGSLAHMFFLFVFL